MLINSFFLSLNTARPSFDYYRQVIRACAYEHSPARTLGAGMYDALPPNKKFKSCLDEFLSSTITKKLIKCFAQCHNTMTGESHISNPSIISLTLYQLSHCASCVHL